MGVSRERARGALRLTLGPATTEAEVETTARAVVEAVGKLRSR
jgi:cysteine sulfinate desulfinase/cysteine desulfurase-like protein